MSDDEEEVKYDRRTSRDSRGELKLPIRLYVRITRDVKETSSHVLAKLQSPNLYNLRTVPLDQAPKHVELIAIHKDNANKLRCIVVFGPLLDVGCVYTSPSSAATCCKGASARNTSVYIDQDFSVTVASVMHRLVNNPALDSYLELGPYIDSTKVFKDFCKNSPYFAKENDPRKVMVDCASKPQLISKSPTLRLPWKFANDIAGVLVLHELGICYECHNSTNEEESVVVCCDSCNREAHFKCLSPPIKSLKDLPPGDWKCKLCSSSISSDSKKLVPKESNSASKESAKKTKKVSNDLVPMEIDDENNTKDISDKRKKIRKANKGKSLDSGSAAGKLMFPDMDQILKQTTLERRSHQFFDNANNLVEDAINFDSPFWWNQQASLAILPNAAFQPFDWSGAFRHIPPPQRLGSSKLSSLTSLFDQLGISGYTANFKTKHIDLSELWLLRESDFESLIPEIGPRRRLEGYIRTYRKEFALITLPKN